MPTSALLQLVAKGRQDAYLTSNPQFTFFKHVYRRYTPFAIESIPIEMDGTLDFGRRISTVIPRRADLLSTLFLEIDLPAIPPDTTDPENPILYYWTNNIGHSMIDYVSIEVGEKEIDRHTGEWLQIWSELTMSAERRDGFNQMVGHWDVYPDTGQSAGPLSLSIPLRFWFCNSIGSALPLVALQAHPIRIIIQLKKFQELWWSRALSCTGSAGICPPPIAPISPARLQLFGDYVYLDPEERKRFATVDHEYLIDQLQFAPPHSVPRQIASVNIPLVFNHCCKEFIWVIKQNHCQKANEWMNFSNVYQSVDNECPESIALQDQVTSALIQLDGYDRFERRNGLYFRIVQPFQRHTNVPNNYIYLYSFSFKPEEEQPSGSLNCSKIDTINLNLVFNTNTIDDDRLVSVYATNYNVFRVTGGLGGLAFYS
jgi:hypothetical protein